MGEVEVCEVLRLSELGQLVLEDRHRVEIPEGVLSDMPEVGSKPVPCTGLRYEERCASPLGRLVRVLQTMTDKRAYKVGWEFPLVLYVLAEANLERLDVTAEFNLERRDSRGRSR